MIEFKVYKMLEFFGGVVCIYYKEGKYLLIYFLFLSYLEIIVY